MEIDVGSVAALWRYPVKSMQGTPSASALLGERGVLGDRAYALRDRATGHIASAKHPRKWAALLACRAEFVAEPDHGAPLPPVRITLPDGAAITSDDAQIHDRLSRLLGRPVELTCTVEPAPTREANRAPVDGDPSVELIREESLALAAPGTFFDHAPLHLLTSATLARLAELYPGGHFAAGRFRPNLLVEATATPTNFPENNWVGGVLRIGAAHIAVLDPTPRCVVTTLAQGELPHDPGILRTIHRHNAAASATVAPGVVLPTIAGVYGALLQAGIVRPGDRVVLLPTDRAPG